VRLITIIAAATAFHSTLAANFDAPLVDIQSVNPTIVVELRYSRTNNLLGQALYPRNARALVRREVAERLTTAQLFLRRYQCGLKIWDAYRPKSVQLRLWQAIPNQDYVANPRTGAGSMHSWGVAVDATLVDTWSNELSMPTDFDDLTPAAMWRYQGTNPGIRNHLYLLQRAMADAGFYGLRTEWWHFNIADWKKYLPPEEAKRAAQCFGTHWEGKL
jgi:zinc D-Ala-D-Ala dipeptidase